jgi:glycerol-3-phosphate cytidylyltransferase
MKKGFACGVFDLFHFGHVLMLKECKDQCDYLVVGINQCKVLGKNKTSPIFPFEHRKLILESNIYVDEVIGYSTENELSNILKKNNFEVRFLGDDYKNKPITSPELSKKIVFINRDHGYSTSLIRKKIKDLDI